MKKIKAKILEISDNIHEDDMEYSMYTRDEFIKELDHNISGLSAAESYLEAMGDECDRLFEESEELSYLAIKEDMRLYLCNIRERYLKEQEKKFWEKKMEQISVGDIYYNYTQKDGSVRFYSVVSKGQKAIKCQELETHITKRSSKKVQPGAPIEGKFYLMKNETIRGAWCCSYTESEPVSLYSSKSFYKNH